ncbi:hypothetical protein VE04_09608, partial [Pseudogymnoascus sp. 24MN13]
MVAKHLHPPPVAPAAPARRRRLKCGTAQPHREARRRRVPRRVLYAAAPRTRTRMRRLIRAPPARRAAPHSVLRIEC